MFKQNVPGHWKIVAIVLPHRSQTLKRRTEATGLKNRFVQAFFTGETDSTENDKNRFVRIKKKLSQLIAIQYRKTNFIHKNTKIDF